MPLRALQTVFCLSKTNLFGSLLSNFPNSKLELSIFSVKLLKFSYFYINSAMNCNK